MTGAILGGSSVSQAAKLQIVIMFMISASAALASIVTTVGTLVMMVDNEHCVCPDRVDVREHTIWRARHWLVSGAVSGIKVAGWTIISCCTRRKTRHENGHGETERLLG